MSVFCEIDGAFCITVENGVFRQRPLFEKGGVIFVSQKGGFIMVMEYRKA